MKKTVNVLLFVFLSSSSFAQENSIATVNTENTDLVIKRTLDLGVDKSKDSLFAIAPITKELPAPKNNEILTYEVDNLKPKEKIEVKHLIDISLDEKIIEGYNAPSHFFDLSDWSLSIPVDADGNKKADNIEEKELSLGYINDYFFATDAGAMVLTCPVGGVKTSANTKYTRVELREMLRRGNTSVKTKGVSENNWVLESSKSVKKAGGYNGELKATLEVNHVTTTGKSSQVGRVIIGQIHAKNNEPVRLYYRKLPKNKKGSLYFAHETKGKGSEKYYEILGNRSDSAKDPKDGIALNEKFTYKISLEGNKLSVSIHKPYGPVITKTIDIKKSGYNAADEYMYFKAGAYTQVAGPKTVVMYDVFNYEY